MKVSKGYIEKETVFPFFASVFAYNGISASFFKQIEYKDQLPELLVRC